MTHYVYSAWDAQGRPLYVGCTNNLARRMKEHRGYSLWFHEAVVMTAIPFSDRHAALNAEARQISKLRPIHNSRHNPRFMTVGEAMEREQWHIDFEALNGTAETRAAWLADNPGASVADRKWIALANLRDAKAAA